MQFFVLDPLTALGHAVTVSCLHAAMLPAGHQEKGNKGTTGGQEEDNKKRTTRGKGTDKGQKEINRRTGSEDRLAAAAKMVEDQKRSGRLEKDKKHKRTREGQRGNKKKTRGGEEKQDCRRTRCGHHLAAAAMLPPEEGHEEDNRRTTPGHCVHQRGQRLWPALFREREREREP